MAEAFNLPQPAGILVQSVAAGSIGDRLGLRGGSIAAKVEGVDLMIGGDIILEVQGVLVTPDAGLRKRYREKVAALKKGDKVLLKVLRGGTVIELQTTWEG
jgi:S1-C subfamily serine protease